MRKVAIISGAIIMWPLTSFGQQGQSDLGSQLGKALGNALVQSITGHPPAGSPSPAAVTGPPNRPSLANNTAVANARSPEASRSTAQSVSSAYTFPGVLKTVAKGVKDCKKAGGYVAKISNATMQGSMLLISSGQGENATGFPMREIPTSVELKSLVGRPTCATPDGD